VTNSGAVTVFPRSAPWQAFDRAIVSTVTGDGGHGPGAIALAELDGDRLPGIATANQVSTDPADEQRPRR
jgi:hypothetical protein